MNPCSQYSLTTTDISQHNRLGLAWLGLAWLGLAWLGLAWPGLAWLGLACGKRASFFQFHIQGRKIKKIS